MTRMIRWHVVGVACVLAAGVAAQETFDGPPQAARGFELFTKTAKPAPCITCHGIGGKGGPVAPDLKMWARLSPRAAAMAITSSVTEKVVVVVPKSGSEFPAIKVSEDEKGYKFYDLSAMPPALKELAKADVDSVKPNATWKHPPAVEKYSHEELADLVAYIRWAGAKDKTKISPDDMQ
jgi:mono/diheme cytochrome c family protein